MFNDFLAGLEKNPGLEGLIIILLGIIFFAVASKFVGEIDADEPAKDDEKVN